MLRHSPRPSHLCTSGFLPCTSGFLPCTFGFLPCTSGFLPCTIFSGQHLLIPQYTNDRLLSVCCSTYVLSALLQPVKFSGKGRIDLFLKHLLFLLLPVYGCFVFATHACSSQRCQKRASVLLELELQTVNYCVSARNQI